MEDRLEAAREVVRKFDMDERWNAAVEGELPPALADLTHAFIDAYRRADLEWLLEHTSTDVEIVQVPEIPDSRTYRGRDGYLDALLDWPRQWEDFQMVPLRIFAPDDEHIVVIAIHRGRAHSVDIEVEDEIVFVTRWMDGTMTNWDMFLTLDEALGRAAERRAHRHDDHAAQGDRRE